MSKLINFTSNAGAQKKINELVDSILRNVLLDEITKINFYVCSKNNNFYLYILFNLINEDLILKVKEQDEIKRKQEEDSKKQIRKCEEIVNIIKESYKDGEKLKKLYEKDESLFEEKIDIDDKFDFTLTELYQWVYCGDRIYWLSRNYYANIFKKLDNITNIDNINIPTAFTRYVTGHNWYDETDTIIDLIEYKGHYYKSGEYKTMPRNNWRGD